MTTFNRGWLVTYTLLCAGLMLGGFASGQVSDFSMRVIGGTDCDSQTDLLDAQCEKSEQPGTCSSVVRRCNQNSGNGTRICQASAGGNACTGVACKSTQHDSLDQNDANGNPCTPVQLSGQ